MSKQVEAASKSRLSFCRTCENFCSVVVEVRDGEAISLVGNRDNPMSAGYTCTKGRAQPSLSRSPDRLLSPQRRGVDGAFAPITSERAIGEIAERLRRIIEEHGPESVAVYRGTSASASTAADHLAQSFLQAIGLSLFFTTNTTTRAAGTSPRLSWGDGWPRAGPGIAPTSDSCSASTPTAAIRACPSGRRPAGSLRRRLAE